MPKQISIQEIEAIWEKHGNPAWSKCIPQVKQFIEAMPLGDLPHNQQLAIVQAASCMAARSYRLGFKIGAAVGAMHQDKRPRIITSLN